MSEILTLLFDQYAKDFGINESEIESQDAEAKYQQLKELVGEETALDIWDAAVSEGAVMLDVYYQAGVKTGIALIFELLSL